MRRRHIALQLAEGQWRYAVASCDRLGATLLQTGFFEEDPQRSLGESLTTVIGPLQMTDRIACAFPARSALVRWLQFPYSDARKIAATAQPEMARQLPGATDNYAFFLQHLGENRALTVAVERGCLEETLEGFDDNREPLGYLGLSPFCYAAALDWEQDGILLCANDAEVTLLRYVDGQPAEIRILPLTGADEHEEIVQQTQLLARKGSEPEMNLRVLGVAQGEGLWSELQQAGFEIGSVRCESEQGPVVDELTAVACLALTACQADGQLLNLRSGEYRLKNDWQGLKRRMWIAGGLLVTTLLLLFGSAVLNYQQRASEVDRLKEQLQELYLKEFPGERMVAPAPLLLQSKMKELRKRSGLFASDAPSALQLLQVISKGIAPELSVEIKEYLYSEEGLRLSGTTVNFDALSKLLAGLQGDERFREVRIIDSKQALDGSQVDFQLQIQLGGGK